MQNKVTIYGYVQVPGGNDVPNNKLVPKICNIEKLQHIMPCQNPIPNNTVMYKQLTECMTGYCLNKLLFKRNTLLSSKMTGSTLSEIRNS